MTEFMHQLRSLVKVSEPSVMYIIFMWCIKVSQAFAFLTLKSLPSHKIETMLFQNNMILQIVNLGLHMIYI